MKTILIIILVLFLIVFVFAWYPLLRAAKNSYDYGIQKIDEKTKYENLKQVEDTCRAMQASYESDKHMWEQYHESENEEKLGWAEAAKIRANKTASYYNQYILKNSFMWSGNVPSDIRMELPYIE